MFPFPVFAEEAGSQDAADMLKENFYDVYRIKILSILHLFQRRGFVGFNMTWFLGCVILVIMTAG